MIYRVIKVESATDKEVAEIGTMHDMQHAEMVAELFNDGEPSQEFFYTVDEVFTPEEQAEIDAAWVEFRKEYPIEHQIQPTQDYENFIKGE